MGKFNYGGQAVIEGVMMRGQYHSAVAVRKTDQSITVLEEDLKPWSDRFPILKKPILRGAVALVESMVMGLRSLNYSASQFGDEEEQLTTKELVMTMGFALVLTVALFIVLPAFLLRFVQSHIASNVMVNLVEGVIKVSIFVIYIVAISWMNDIKRVFAYHGAEHKTINCYEAGEELIAENVAKHSRVHARCGTNFLLIVLFTSVFVFSFFGRPPFLQRILIHLAIMPIVAGLSYELIRKAGQKDCHPIFKWVAKPGMLLQNLTTIEPDQQMIEVAIKALETVLDKDAIHPETKKVVAFPASDPSA
ncbi:MAG TPA: DUF1385 domain-containing protein [Firmicutes bacterium]|jgi:uncharacterized protein YqhQ|nr:DUF1385 domain-containing protein [Bacillota bacterium]